MIGFDRPVKPEWIYKILKLLKPGKNISSYYVPFEKIASELVGKEGKRKVRTVIFRSFLYSFQENKKLVENNPFIEWSEQDTLEQLVPLFLAKLLMDYDVCRFITKKIQTSLDQSGQFSSIILSKRMVQEYGDRDVVKRSVRSFLKTLLHFKIIEQIDTNNYRLINAYEMNHEQIRQFFLLYSLAFLKSKVVDLSQIDNTLTFYFAEMNFSEIAWKYHLKDWEYIRDAGRDLLLLR